MNMSAEKTLKIGTEFTFEYVYVTRIVNIAGSIVNSSPPLLVFWGVSWGSTSPSTPQFAPERCLCFCIAFQAHPIWQGGHLRDLHHAALRPFAP